MSGHQWLTGSPATRLLREYEKLIDEYHTTLPFFRNLDHSSVFFALAAFDSLLIACQSHLMPHIAAGEIVQPLKSIEEGLSTGLRWLADQDLPSNGIMPREDADAFNNAGEFLNHSMNYADVQDMHISLNRGLVHVEASPKTKAIRFHIDANQDSLQGVDWIIIEGERRRRRVSSFSFKSFERLSSVQAFLLNQRATYHDGRIVLEDPNALRNEDYQQFLSRLLSGKPQFIDNNDDLGGFSGSEFTSVWISLLGWSLAIVPQFLNLSENGRFQPRCLPTQVVPRDEFLNVIEHLCGLSKDKVQLIMDRLTLGNNVTKQEVFLQPIIANDTHVCWSVFVVLNSSYQRNMLKLMARSPIHVKSLSDNLVGAKERHFLGEVGRLLSSRGYQFKILSKYKSEHTEGDVDLIAYHTSSRGEVLIVEGKTVLPPDEINEVDSVTEDLIAAQDQLRKSIDYISDGNGHRLWKQVDWESVERICGIVLTPQTTPNPRYDFSEFPCGTLELLRMYARPKDLKRPSRIWRFLKDRAWLSELSDADHGHREIAVGGITYLLPELRMM